MNYKADELEDAGGDEALIGTYERNAQTLSMAAKQYKKSLTSLNSASSRASRNRTVWQVVKTAQIQWAPAGSFRTRWRRLPRRRRTIRRRWIAKRGNWQRGFARRRICCRLRKPAKRPDSITIHDRSGK
ncbi:MAG: hypothetical protein ACLR8P_08255 [Clostridium fessum]